MIQTIPPSSKPVILGDVVRRVYEELTRKMEYGNRLYVFAPHLALLGETLRAAWEQHNPETRADVARFGRLMASVMDAKDAEKGPATLSFTICLMRIQAQLRKFEDRPAPTAQESRVILTHIANFAMIGERDLSTQIGTL